MSVEPQILTHAERTYLLQLARQTIATSARTGQEPPVREEDVTRALRVERACFVTLTRQGTLRGCIGNLQPREPLFRAVMENARSAAFRDTRFTPVEPAELDALNIEISVLNEPQPVEFHSPEELLQMLKPGMDGVILRNEGRTVTFLPQVWATIPQPERFLRALSQKAGLAGEAWSDPETRLMTYQVESFETAHAA